MKLLDAHDKRIYRMGRRDGIIFMLKWFFKLRTIDFDKLIQEEEEKENSKTSNDVYESIKQGLEDAINGNVRRIKYE